MHMSNVQAELILNMNPMLYKRTLKTLSCRHMLKSFQCDKGTDCKIREQPPVA